MNIILCILLSIITVNVGICQPSKNRLIDYAYEENNCIFYHLLGVKQLVKISNASNPNLSPTGKNLAYRLHKGDSSDIKIIYTDKQHSQHIKAPYKHNHSPKWNKDGTLLSFISSNGDRTLLVLHNLSDITKSIPLPEDCTNPSWDTERHLILNNLDSLYYVDTSGKIIARYINKKIFKDHWIVTPTSTQTTKNHRQIYFCATNRQSSYKCPPDGPTAIYCYDFNTDSTTRVTQNHLSCSGEFTFTNDTLYFSARDRCDTKTFVYIKTPTKLTKTKIIGQNITVTAKNSL